MSKKLLIICGPTASGKSYLGHYLAKIHNGEIINGDSMQIYQQIPIITASPAQIYRDELPYHLYNFLSINQKFSVIKYVNLAVEKITDITYLGSILICPNYSSKKRLETTIQWQKPQRLEHQNQKLRPQ